MAKTKEEQVLAVDSGRQDLLKEEEKEIEKLSSWLWFEFTPYEVGCDELGGMILPNFSDRSETHVTSNKSLDPKLVPWPAI